MSKKLFFRQLPMNAKVNKVKAVFNTVSGSRRHPPAIRVNRYGRALTNAEAGEEWQTFFLGEGIDPLQAWVTFGTNSELGLIFVYAAVKTEEGAIDAKFDPETRTYSTHFGAALKEAPDLRPLTTVEAQYEPSLDQEGRHCLAVNIKAAKAKRAGAADPEEMAARAEEEAAKAEAKAAAKKRVAAAKQGRGKAKNSGGGAGDGEPNAE